MPFIVSVTYSERCKQYYRRDGEDFIPTISRDHATRLSEAEADTLAAEWARPYSRLEAAYPASDPDTAAKYWPPVSRIDNVAGDRNLVCSCPPVAEYLGAAE